MNHETLHSNLFKRKKENKQLFMEKVWRRERTHMNYTHASTHTDTQIDTHTHTHTHTRTHARTLTHTHTHLSLIHISEPTRQS